MTAATPKTRPDDRPTVDFINHANQGPASWLAPRRSEATMSTTTFSDFPDDRHDDRTSPNARQNEPHLAVQILSVIAFGAFGIVAISLAFHAFWLAGLFLAAVIAWTWAGSRTFGGRNQWTDSWASCSINDLTPIVSKKRSTGNTSFDAHRAEMLKRLEQESRDFRDFLTRLREADDAKEFDQFMDDRAAKARETKSDPES